MNDRHLVFTAAFLALGIVNLAAQETPSPTRLTTDHYFELERISNAQISPDGAHVVYTRQQVNRIEDKWDSSLWIMNADGTRHRFLAKGASARWAPDGKRILYLAEGEPRGTQIFVRWIDAEGAASQVTHATEKVADANWSRRTAGLRARSPAANGALGLVNCEVPWSWTGLPTRSLSWSSATATPTPTCSASVRNC